MRMTKRQLEKNRAMINKGMDMDCELFAALSGDNPEERKKLVKKAWHQSIATMAYSLEEFDVATLSGQNIVSVYIRERRIVTADEDGRLHYWKFKPTIKEYGDNEYYVNNFEEE